MPAIILLLQLLAGVIYLYKLKSGYVKYMSIVGGVKLLVMGSVAHQVLNSMAK